MENLESNDLDNIRNQRIVNKEKLFKKKLRDIEEANKDYFKSRQSIGDKDELHDFLHNHVVLVPSDDTLILVWPEKSDLADSIRSEVVEAFNSVYVP